MDEGTRCATGHAVPAHNGFLCQRCWADLDTALRSVCEPGPDGATLLDDLDTTISRQDRVSGDPVGVVTRADRGALPLKPHGIVARDKLRRALANWVFTIAGYHGIGIDFLTSDIAESARWLLRHPNSIRGTEAAGRIRADVLAAVEQCRRAIDCHPGRLRLGRCGADTDDGQCPRYLHAPKPGPGETEDRYVQCRDCGTEWNVHERRMDLLEAARQLWVTTKEARDYLGDHFLGRPVTDSMIRNHRNRGNLRARGHIDRDGNISIGDDKDGVPGWKLLFEFGELQDVLKRHAAATLLLRATWADATLRETA